VSVVRGQSSVAKSKDDGTPFATDNGQQTTDAARGELAADSEQQAESELSENGPNDH
jgi:hypothetical protein